MKPLSIAHCLLTIEDSAARTPCGHSMVNGQWTIGNGRRGTILVAVLIVTALASMVAVTAMYRMHSESAACAASTLNEQAHAAAMSGIARVTALLRVVRESGIDLYDNPGLLRNQLVCDDGINKWYFTVYAGADTPGFGGSTFDSAGDAKVRYGVIDEAAKININFATPESLLALPGMTEELADCLVDFRDRDNEPLPNGAEQEYYDQLPRPYKAKNGFFFTLEETLLVKGFNGSLLYGEDANLNGMLEPNEDDGDATFPTDDSDGQLNPGLRGLATTLTYEPDVDNEGQARTNLNTAVRSVEGLDPRTTAFIQAYLADKNVFTHPSQLLNMEYRLKADQPVKAGQTGRKAGEVIYSYVDASTLPLVLDRLTANPSKMPLFGLLNVNSAPAGALAAVPGMDADLARRIVDARASIAPEARATTAWLFTEGLMDADRFKQVAPRLTARTFQYRVQCVGFGWPCGRYRVIEAVVDLAGGTPRLLYMRDLTRMGVPLPLNVDSGEG